MSLNFIIAKWRVRLEAEKAYPPFARIITEFLKDLEEVSP
jgi:hypothetical protein